MASVKYNPDGSMVKPRIITIHQLWAKVPGGGSVRLEATSNAELWANYYDGRRRGIYCGVIGTAERQGEDPAEAKAYSAELSRISRTSCPLTEDYLPMRRFVKSLPPERYNEIDTTWLAGYSHLRAWLEFQRITRAQECHDKGIIPAPCECRPWWVRDYPWKNNAATASAQDIKRFTY